MAFKKATALQLPATLALWAFHFCPCFSKAAAGWLLTLTKQLQARAQHMVPASSPPAPVECTVFPSKRPSGRCWGMMSVRVA